jgi:hypothetical protein
MDCLLIGAPGANVGPVHIVPADRGALDPPPPHGVAGPRGVQAGLAWHDGSRMAHHDAPCAVLYYSLGFARDEFE